MSTADIFEFSEFSIYEILYMGHMGLTYIVDTSIDEAARDPFDIIAEREEHLGQPLALIVKGVNDM